MKRKIQLLTALAATVSIVQGQRPVPPPAVIAAPPGSATVEQKSQGAKPGAMLVASFDGMGVGFQRPQGPSNARNPSEKSLAVGPNHIVQVVNSTVAIFTKKGKLFD